MRLRLALAAVCLVGALLAVVLARDVWRHEKALRDGDARAHAGKVDAKAWDATTLFPGDPTRALLGVDDDVAFRALYTHAAALAVRPPSGERDPQRTLTESALGRLVRTERNLVRASQASNVLAVLLFTDPDDPENSPAQRALGALQDAVLLDPGNAVAKANLELILRQLTTESPQGRSSPGGGDTGGKGGAGLAPAGRGY
jgi:hypothetical protein